MMCLNILMDSLAQKQLHANDWVNMIALQKNGTHLAFGCIWCFFHKSHNLRISHVTLPKCVKKVAAGAPEVNFLALALTGKQARLIYRGDLGTNPRDEM